MNKSISKNYGSFLVLLSALMFGSYGVWSRLIGGSMESFFQGWTRSLIILILLLPIAFFRKELVQIKKADWGWMAVFLGFTSLTQAPIFYAFNHMDIPTASLLFFVSTFLTMVIIGACCFQERFTPVKIVSSLLALLGMYLVFSFSLTSFALFAALMAVLNGIASGGEIAFSKKLSGKYPPLFLVVMSWGIILITNFLLSIMLSETQVTPSFSAPWFLQLCYSMASLFGFWFVIAGVKLVDASIAALVGLLEIVFSILFAMLIFQESLTFSVGIGGLLIILAASLPSIHEIYLLRRP